MVTGKSRQGFSHAFSASVAQLLVPVGATEAWHRLDGACAVPPLVTRALREPEEPFEWGSASSGGRIVGETMMALEFGRAVPCATHSANEGHRHHCQSLKHSFGYQQIQGQDTGASRWKTLAVSAHESYFRWTVAQNRSQSPCHPRCPSEGLHQALSHVHRPPPCRSSHAHAHPY